MRATAVIPMQSMLPTSDPWPKQFDQFYGYGAVKHLVNPGARLRRTGECPARGFGVAHAKRRMS